MEVTEIIQIIDRNAFIQVGWDKLVRGLYTSSTTKIPHHLRHHFPGAPGDRRPGSGDGCRMRFVNSWALGWSRDM